MDKTIDSFLDNEYKNYAEEVSFKRALPSAIDGMKPVRRKIFYYMSKNKNSGFIKVSAIAGGIAEKCNYHHGDASQAIINMAKDFPSSNNYSMLLPKGMFGSKLLPGSSAASRYIHAKYNSINDLIFLDNDLIEPNHDLESPEPEFYLPIIPIHLINGMNGIGIGYAVKIFSRKLSDIVTSILECIDNVDITNAAPYFNKCNYNIQQLTMKSFEISGKYHIEKDKLVVTELIPGMDRNKFVEHLIKLQDKNIIKTYNDESKLDFKFVIKLSDNLTHDKILQVFNLTKVFHENYTMLDHLNNIITFDSYNEIIKYFTDYRLKIYTKRKSLAIKKLNEEIEKIEAIIIFIKNMKDIINAKSIDEIKILFKDKLKPESIEYCLKRPLSNFMKMNIDDLNNNIKEHQNMIQYYSSVEEKTLYKNDLNTLLKAMNE